MPTCIASPQAVAESAGRDPYLDQSTIEFRFRQKRFALIRPLIEAALKQRGRAEILDLGGTETYWRVGGEFIEKNRNRLHITLVNTQESPVTQTDLFDSVLQSATDPGLFRERRFDLVHSNSVIEHVGAWQDMQMFAANVRRLAPRYYVQTPNYWFAYEPHFRFPGFQYLPESVRTWLVRHHSFGFFSRIDDPEEARDIIRHHRLLSTSQMHTLFPDATIVHEKAFGLNKSIVAYRDAAA